MNHQIEIDINEIENLMRTIRDNEINNILSQFSHQHGLLNEEKVVLKNYKNYFPSREECAICQENYCCFDNLTELPCGHKFHKDCVDIWLKNNTTCPMCRHNIRNDSQDILKVLIMMTIIRNVFLKVVPYIHYYHRQTMESEDQEETKNKETWFEYIKSKVIKYLQY